MIFEEMRPTLEPGGCVLLGNARLTRCKSSDEEADNANCPGNGADEKRTFTGSRRPWNGIAIGQPVLLGERIQFLGDAVNEGSPA
jgi:hypothetical protein